MFHHYLISAIRSVTRQRLYSFINIIGLAVGLACAIFIALYLRDELSYDKWIADSQNIYRIEETYYFPDGSSKFFPRTPFPASIAMREQIPEVVAQTHLIPEPMTAQIGDRLFPVSVDAVDPNFFQMIKLPLVEGDPTAALAEPESIVLSQATARKFFGTADPLGRTVMLGGSHLLTVTGVLRDLPHNTHLVADLVVPNTSKADTFIPEARRVWLNVRGWGYVKLSPGVDPGTVLARLPPILDKDVVSRMPNVKMLGSQILHLHLTPFRDVHLAAGGETEAGNWTRIYGFAAIAGMILLIACFNFMNLATARATLRAREVSLRKTVGAKRQQLIAQFLGESVMMALIASVLALALVELLLPAFDNFLALPIAFHYLGDWPLTLAIAAIAVSAGLFGGVYPALVLSGFRPAAILGAGAPGISGSGFLRLALVVLQFAIAIGLGIATIVVFAQLRYARQIDIGFDHHNMVVINGARNITLSTFDGMAEAIAADPAVAGVAQSDQVPFDGGGGVYAPAHLPGGTQNFSLRVVQVDPDFLSLYGAKLLAGRNLSRARGEDMFAEIPPKTDGNTLVNATAARQFGYTPASAIGHSILFGENNARLTIVGVVGDVNFDGFQKSMEPFIYLYSPDWVPTLSVRIKPGDIPAGLAAIDRIWHQFAPTVAIRRHFQDESFDKQFLADEQEGAIFGLFVGIAIFIACLGLFGLAAFVAERRTKEIGTRKVFGAGTRGIVWLLLWQFSIPVLIANFIAWPVAWFYLHHWLEAYAYRISLSPLYFFGAGAVALIIAWATIYAHALQVARANPIHALRYE